MTKEALTTLWEDKDVFLLLKPPSVNSEHTEDKSGLPDLFQAERGGDCFPIHRLDFGVGGALLCAGTAKAAAALSRSLAEGKIKKEYLAIAHGTLPEKGRMDDLLFYDRKAGKSFVVQRERKGVKAASLAFSLVKTLDTPFGLLSLVRVFPETGRTHQIRAQFANAAHPLLGDKKYGAKESAPIGLCCSRLTFPHPTTNETITVEYLPSGDPWNLFSAP